MAIFEKKSKNNGFLLLYLMIFICKIHLCLFLKCNYSQPINKNGECISDGCTTDEFESGICSIENEIIKTQWITNRIGYSGLGGHYANLATTPKGDLICISNYYLTSTSKEFYGLKKNGRPYFKDNNNVETPFHEIDSKAKKYEGNVFAIQLNGDDKEYAISFGNNNGFFEIFDFENDKVYVQEVKKIFETGYTFFHYGSIFKLSSDNNYYFISLISQDKSGSGNKFFLMKFLFSNLDIANNMPYKTSVLLSSSDNCISSCFESENKYCKI
jgi:hypothetical protein